MFNQYGWQTARSLIRSIGGFPHDDFPFNFNQVYKKLQKIII